MSAGKPIDDASARREMGERLRESRKYLGLRQDEVAQYLKIPRTALTDIENGTVCHEARDEGEAAARFLAAALAPGCSLPAAALVMTGRTTPAVQRAAFAVGQALGAQAGDLAGPVKRKGDVDALLTAALAQLASGDRVGAERTAALVAGDERIERALLRLIAARAGLGKPASARARVRAIPAPEVVRERMANGSHRAVPGG